MRKWLWLLLLICHQASGDQLIIEPEMGREPILNEISKAKHSIHLVMYGFTDKTFLDFLLAQHKDHKEVQVLLENHPFRAEHENDDAIATLNANHIARQGSIPPFRLIHQKTWLIDGHRAIVMTFNLTHSAFKRVRYGNPIKKQRNFAIILEDEKKVKEIEALFSADWQHLPTHVTSSDIIVSPDNSRDALLNLITKAKRSIRIYAQTVSDYRLIHALKDAANKGIQVQILCSKMRDKVQQKSMLREGIDLKISQKMIIHAKVIIIDDKTALLGSINLTNPSIEDNRELSVLTSDKKVLDPLLLTFHRDWQQE